MSGLLITLAFLCLVSHVHLLEEAAFALPTPETSAFALFLSTDALIVTADESLRYLERDVLSSVIPDITQKIKTSTGSAEISLTNMRIDQFSIGKLAIDTDVNNQVLSGYLKDNKFLLSFNYDYKQLSFPYRSEKGSGAVSTIGMVISASVSTDLLTDSGHLFINIETLTFDIGSIEIDMEGGALADLIKTLDTMFSDIIEDVLSESIGDFLRDLIEPALEEMSNYPYAKCVNGNCSDLRMSINMVLKQTGIRVVMGGTFFPESDQTLYVPPNFTGVIPDVQNTQGLQMQLARPCFESYLSSMQTNGYLDYYHFFIPETDGSSFVGYDSMVKYFPVWANKYPVGTGANVFFAIHDYSTVEIMYTGLRITMNYTVTVTPFEMEDVTGITSEVSIVLLGDFYWKFYHHTNMPMDEGTACLTIEASFISAKEKGVGVLNPEWMAGVVNSILLPKLNWEFGVSIIYVYQGFQYLENPHVVYNGDYVMVSADPLYV